MTRFRVRAEEFALEGEGREYRVAGTSLDGRNRMGQGKVRVEFVGQFVVF